MTSETLEACQNLLTFGAGAFTLLLILKILFPGDVR